MYARPLQTGSTERRGNAGTFGLDQNVLLAYPEGQRLAGKLMHLARVTASLYEQNAGFDSDGHQNVSEPHEKTSLYPVSFL